jgi:DNA-binding NarL/FixJ family response regulator
MLPPITAIVAHRHPQFRTILKNVVRSQSRLQVVAVASSAVELRELAKLHSPDIIVADISLPGLPRFVKLIQANASGKSPLFLFSWRYRDQKLLKLIMNIISASYIVLDAPPAKYGIAIRQAMKGKPYLCEQTQNFLNSGGASPADAILAGKFGGKFLLLISCEILGYNCKEAATASELKWESVRTYRKRYKKLLGSRTFEALIWAFKNGEW